MKLANHLDVANNQIKNASFESFPVNDPGTVFDGKMIYNQTSKTIKWYDGTAWRSAISSVAPLTGAMTSIITVATSAGGLVTLSIADATGSFSGLLSSAHYTLLFQATANSTVSTLVARDASSNFAANFITANKVTGLGTPSADTDAANKKYVDDTVSGLAWKDAVHVATTGAITLAGFPSIDGHTVQPGERVLVKDQTSTGLGGTTSPENGIWIAAAGLWTRALDADTEQELLGTSVLVQQGTLLQNTQWIMTTDTIPTLWTTGGTTSSSPIAFAQFGTGSSVYTAGAGLVLNGSAFDVGGTVNRITVGADSIDIASTYAGQSSIVTLGTVAAGTWNGTTIGAGFGGTGQTTYAIGDILYASAATTLSKLTAIAAGNVLLSGGVTAAPAWGKVQLASGASQHVAGTLPTGNGGTGGTATPTSGGVAYGASSVYAFTAAGTSGQVLLSAGAGTPTFGQVSLSSGSAGVSGTLAVVNGGTGSATALVAGGLAVAASTTAYGTIAAVATGSVLLSAGIGVAPAFGQLGLGSAAVSGTLGITNGGTGSTTVSGVRTALATPTQVFGDVGNSSASIQITHSIGTKDVNVEVYETATGATVYCDVTRDTINTVTLTFSGTPAAANTYRYVITGRTV